MKLWLLVVRDPHGVMEVQWADIDAKGQVSLSGRKVKKVLSSLFPDRLVLRGNEPSPSEAQIEIVNVYAGYNKTTLRSLFLGPETWGLVEKC